MEDDLKKNKKNEDDLNFFYFLMEGDPQQIMQPKTIKSKNNNISENRR